MQKTMPDIVPGPILIIGTGISGLTLAQGLLNANIPFRPPVRARPGLLRARAGLPHPPRRHGARGAPGDAPPALFAEVEATCAPFTAGASLDALTAQVLERRGPPPAGIHGGKQIAADRTILRRVLLRGLEVHVEFGKRFVAYELTARGGTLLVGADGARSGVRRQFLPGVGLLDTEGRLIYGKTSLTRELEETFDARAMAGLSMLRDAARAGPLSAVLEPMRFHVGVGESRAEKGLPVDYVCWVLACRSDVLGMPDTELLGLSTEEAAALSLRLTADSHPSLRALFTLQDATQSSALSIASVKPEIPTWPSSDHVRLIGDAIHVMSPTAGIGANMALRDAALLVKTLAKKGDIGSYEAKMREYAGETIRMSRMGGQILFGMRSFEELKPECII
ncbi:cercosporin toxin biosynthesis protein [Mycena maculata]|uniref:Cercosporin toxin biosynthesis protein n=1 Tax=Mycena maculata TaxID=230809 RepID=A0AAD7IET5_9AGAR|nr:cercosporin toxin biosynthesis protein [Mycena maculata]